MSVKTVAVVGAFDTKGEEFGFLKGQLEKNGTRTLLIDVGIFGPTFGIRPDVPAEEVALAGGVPLKELVEKKDRGLAMETMCRGAAVVAKKLYDEGRIDGIISLGGSGGSAMGTSAMRALPIGVPKVMVSTMASGDVYIYVRESDIMMMPSIVDISGLNHFSRMIISNAANAVAGMMNGPKPKAEEAKPLVAATMFGVTTPCVTHAREVLEKAGYDVLVFHAVGTGGRTMESLVRGGFIKGVLDITTTELCDELVGGVLSAGPDRLEAAGEKGIPQIVSAGALDMVNFGPMDTVPEKFRGRKLAVHNPTVTLMRTTVEENRKLAEIIASKLNKARGKTIFLMPLKGVSMLDDVNKPFHDPEADKVFIDTLKANLGPNVELIEMDAHINDDAFSEKAASLLIDLLKNK